MSDLLGYIFIGAGVLYLLWAFGIIIFAPDSYPDIHSQPSKGNKMRVSEFTAIGGVMSAFIVWAAIFAGAFLLGPYCFAYDINRLVPLLTHKPMTSPVSMWNLPIFIGGVFLSEVAVPVAIIVWVLVAIGVL